MWLPSLASPSWLGIWHCRKLRRRSQMVLRSSVAMTGVGLQLQFWFNHPNLGASIGCRCSSKLKKKKNCSPLLFPSWFPDCFHIPRRCVCCPWGAWRGVFKGERLGGGKISFHLMEGQVDGCTFLSITPIFLSSVGGHTSSMSTKGRSPILLTRRVNHIGVYCSE